MTTASFRDIFILYNDIFIYLKGKKESAGFLNIIAPTPLKCEPAYRTLETTFYIENLTKIRLTTSIKQR